jgi:hypothetical protein
MTEGQLGFLIGGALMFFIMPISLNQAGQKRRQLKDSEFRDTMLKSPDQSPIRPELLLSGAVLAAVWVLALLIVFNA